MNSDWNPAGASTWCRLSGDLPQVAGNVFIVVGDASEKISSFFEATIPSLVENLQGQSLRLPENPETEDLIQLLGETLASLFPEIGPEFSNLGPAKWVDAIKEQRAKGEMNDRWLLVDQFHRVLKAPAIDRRIFSSILQQLSDLPSVGVIAGITTDSAPEMAVLLNLIDTTKSGKKVTRLNSSDTTPIPRIEAVMPPKKVPGKSEAGGGSWLRAAAVIAILGVLSGGGYACFKQIQQKTAIGGENSIAFGVRPGNDGVPQTTTIADIGKTEGKPLELVVIAPIEPAGFSKQKTELNIQPTPLKQSADLEEFDTERVQKDWKFHPNKNAPEFEVQYFMGEAYCFGHGVEKDLKKGITMLEAASRDGSEKAANLLGTCYSRGYGVEKNYKRAHELLNLAIERGNPFAYGNLGVLHLRGFGCEADPTKAQELFLKGADKGDPVAAFFAAKCFEDGIGVDTEKPDQNRAVYWYLQAAEWGHDEAIAWCREKKLMPPADKMIRF